MQIFLQPPSPEALSFEVDFHIQQAIVALRDNLTETPIPPYRRRAKRGRNV